MRIPSIILPLIFLFLPACAGFPKSHKVSVDGGECQPETPQVETVYESPPFLVKPPGMTVSGKITIKRLTGTGAHCRVVFELLVREQGEDSAQIAKSATLETEQGEIAGIDLIGLSPRGAMFAANFWTAEGDGIAHRPVVYDIRRRTALYLPLESRIQSRIHGCDQPEDFVGVTETGEALFAIPPSDYADTAECGDKGLWRFNLRTGRVYRVAKISGDKWQ